jgi:hypothetical protein
MTSVNLEEQVHDDRFAMRHMKGRKETRPVLTDTGMTLSVELVQPADQGGEASTRSHRYVALRVPEFIQRFLGAERTESEANGGPQNDRRTTERKYVPMGNGCQGGANSTLFKGRGMWVEKHVAGFSATTGVSLRCSGGVGEV